MKELVMFEGKHEVMVLTKEEVGFEFKGEFLIKAKDVSTVLGYTKTQDFTTLIKPKYLVKVKNGDLSKYGNSVIRKLHNTGEIFISSFGLNQGLSISKMPKAEPFQDWLFEDVLPSISKHEAYMTANKVEEVLLNPDTIIKLATELKSEREKRIAAEKQMVEIAPKLAYIDTILQSKGTVTTSQIAADYGMTAQELNKILSSRGVQRKVNGQWILYRSHADKGYTQSKSFDFKHKDGTPDVKMNTQWTQRGRLFIHKILTDLGISANIEKMFRDAK